MIKEQILTVKAELKKCPDGTLIINRKDGTYRFYHQTYEGKKKVRKYLGQKDLPVKVSLARKRVLEALLRDYQDALAVWENLNVADEPHHAEKVWESAPIRQIILEASQQWAQSNYPRNDIFLDHCIHAGPNGVFVRSKSEKDILWGLYEWELPNQYDRKFRLGGQIVSPDFTIKDPVTGKLILWEHFGMMDDPDYARKTYDKLSLYIQHGYFPGENLIVTFEDKKHPLTHERIEAEIHYHFGAWTKANGKRK